MNDHKHCDIYYCYRSGKHMMTILSNICCFFLSFRLGKSVENLCLYTEKLYSKSIFAKSYSFISIIV